MQYFLIYGIFALWVLFDGLSRKMAISAVLWTIGTGILGPVILPIYLASRPLKQGEVREGGKGWNLLKNFAILWTIVMAIASVVYFMEMAKSTASLGSGAAMAGAGIGIVIGMSLFAAVWFFPTIGAALLGFLLKKNTVIEVGPTGPLVGQGSTANAAGGWAGLAAVALLGLVAVGLRGLVHPGAEKNIARGANSSADVTQQPDHSVNNRTSPSAVSGGWRVSQEANAMDATKEAYISLDASNEIEAVIGSYRPNLTIQCRKRHLDVAIALGNQVQSEWGDYHTHPVRVRFDDAKPASQRWIGATSGDALYSPNPTQLLKELSKTKTFLFEFTPFERSPTTVTFSVPSFRKELDSVRDACGFAL
jgi:hypothetical protein